MSTNRKPTRTWQDIAADMTGETDPQKLTILVEELNRAFEERDAARKKIAPTA